jgi:F-type H+-transporting ATPase subunit delta
LTEKLEKLSGKKVSLVQKVDPAVVGGLRVEIDGKQYDGTVQGRMSELSGKIKNVIV